MGVLDLVIPASTSPNVSEQYCIDVCWKSAAFVNYASGPGPSLRQWHRLFLSQIGN
jgi:hypothetical protein